MLDLIYEFVNAIWSNWLTDFVLSVIFLIALLTIAGASIKKHFKNFKFLWLLRFNRDEFIKSAEEEDRKKKPKASENQFLKNVNKLRNSIGQAFLTVLRVLICAGSLAYVLRRMPFPTEVMILFQVFSASIILWALIGRLGHSMQTWDGDTLPEQMDFFWFIILNVIGGFVLFFIYFYALFSNKLFVMGELISEWIYRVISIALLLFVGIGCAKVFSILIKRMLDKRDKQLIFGIIVFIVGIATLNWCRVLPLKSKLFSGLIFSLYTSFFFVKNLQERIYIWALDEIQEKEKKLSVADKNEVEISKNIFYCVSKFKAKCDTLPTWLGALEQLLYVPAVVFVKWQFIAVWLGFKVAGIWKIWEKEKDRLAYNTFVIGNALSLLNAFLWAFFLRPEIFL